MEESSAGIRKSAILMLALAPAQAEAILARLDEPARQRILSDMDALREVDAAERQAVLEECRRELAGEAERPRAEEFLPRLTAGAIHNRLAGEHPQIIAAVLARLDPARSGECLGLFPVSMQVELLRRMERQRRPDAEAMRRIEDYLTGAAAIEPAPAEPPAPPAEDAELLARVLDEAISDGARQNADPVELDELLRLPEAAVRGVLTHLSEREMELLVMGATTRARRTLLQIMPRQRAAASVTTPAYLEEIEAARRRVGQLLARMEAAGEIQLSDRRKPCP